MRITLIIKRHWFDEIKSGKKKKEYRNLTERLAKQICTFDESKKMTGFKPITEIMLYNGYHKNRPSMLVECVGIEIEQDLFEPEFEVFVFLLGKVLESAP